MRWPALVFLAALFAPIACEAAETVVPGAMVPVGYCQLTATGSAAEVSTCTGGIPVGTSVAYITVETANIRWRDDGVAPTASVGMLIVAAAPVLLYQGDITKMQVIAVSGSPVIDISFYKVHP
jgi:hypothetical protein